MKARSVFLSTVLLMGASLGQLTFPNDPIHIGGFLGDTDIENFAYDSSGNLVVESISTDTAIITSTTQATHILMYLRSTDTNWFWAKQLFNFPADKLQSMQIGDLSESKIALFYRSSSIIILNKATGSISSAKKLNPLSFSCSATIDMLCKLLYVGSNLNIFGSDPSNPMLLKTGVFDPSFGSLSLSQWYVGNYFSLQGIGIGEDGAFILGGQYGLSEDGIVGIDALHSTLNFIVNFKHNYKLKMMTMHDWSYYCFLCTGYGFKVFILSQNSDVSSIFKYMLLEVNDNAFNRIDQPQASFIFSFGPSGTIGKALQQVNFDLTLTGSQYTL